MVDGVWQKAAERIRASLGQVVYETWISPLNFIDLHGGTATIEAPNRFFCDWVKDRYLELMQQMLSTEVGGTVEVSLTVREAAGSSNRSNGNGSRSSNDLASKAMVKATMATGSRANEAERRPPHPELNPRFTFAQFVVGSSNQLAHAAALAVAERPGEKYNPLFIYGGVGLGKTHLVTAIGHQLWNSSTTGRRVLFMPAETFMNELISSIRRERMGEFKQRFRRIDALILDDIQFLAGRERTQEEFFHTFNALHSERHQIILTSDKMPREISGLEERLRNRFESGLIADIAAPDLETRIAILQKKAALEGLTLPGEVAMYAAQNICANVRELEGCLTRLAALASLTGAPTTMEFARQALRDLIPTYESKPGIEAVQRAVADSFHIHLADLKSKKRTQHVAFGRQVAMYLCRKLTSNSFPSIGEHFGRDHSTVIHAFNLIERRVNNDAAFRLLLEKIERGLKHVPTNAIPGNRRDSGPSVRQAGG
ncbi:MAG: chromosomal replication initiator protein DnaA [Deltaproteobacteria bacterium]|nr:chromosomal replication initiator protein DnaA [Deltaproteobacteria bacterium]